jgi:hypothetical protein
MYIIKVLFILNFIIIKTFETFFRSFLWSW